MIEVICRYIRKNGRIIYPKNGKYFHFYVDKKIRHKTMMKRKV